MRREWLSNDIFTALESDNKLTENEWNKIESQINTLINLLPEENSNQLEKKYNELKEFFDSEWEQIIENTKQDLNDFKNIINNNEKSSLVLQKNNFEKFIYNKILKIWFSNEITNQLVNNINQIAEEKFDSFDIDKDWNLSDKEKKNLVLLLEEEVSKIITDEVDKKKLNDILLSVIEYNFKIEVSIDFTLKWDVNTSYQSIDNHNPEYTNKDYSEKLERIFKSYRKKWSWAVTATSEIYYDNIKNNINIKNQSVNKIGLNKLENNLEENKKILKIISDFYDTNKNIIEKKLWIKNIKELTPKQATKLVSLITMSKLNYDYWQIISPWKEEDYLKWLNKNEKLEYKKSLLSTYIMTPILYGEVIWFIETDYLKTNNYDEILNNYNLDKYKNLSIKDIEKKWNEIATLVLNKIWVNEENINNLLKDAYLWPIVKTSVYWNTKFWKQSVSWNDIKTVSELLEWWKWVCRNYAVANEKLFEALKTIQNKENNQLKNSILINYEWNDDIDIKWNIANSESWTEGHAWNILVSIWKDWNFYVTQIDSNHADTWWIEWWKTTWINISSTIKNVNTIDRTFDRLLNDIADKANSMEYFEWAIKQLNNYVLTLEKTDWDIDKILMLKMKMLKFYDVLWKEKETEIILSEINDYASLKIKKSENILKVCKELYTLWIWFSMYSTNLATKFESKINSNNLEKSLILIMSLRNLSDREVWSLKAQNVYNESFWKNKEFIKLSKDEKINSIDSLGVPNFIKERFKPKIINWTFDEI